MNELPFWIFPIFPQPVLWSVWPRRKGESHRSGTGQYSKSFLRSFSYLQNSIEIIILDSIQLPLYNN
jgi:hypothetical protein